MSTPETSLCDALRNWISTELPHIPLPSDETLTHLIQGRAAQELWHFFIRRVRTERNARHIRAFLKVYGGRDEKKAAHVEETDVEDLQEVEREIGQVQAEIDLLRKQLVKADGNGHCGKSDLFGCDGGDVTCEEMRDAARAALYDSVHVLEEEVTNVSHGLRQSAWDCAESSTESSEGGEKSGRGGKEDLQTLIQTASEGVVARDADSLHVDFEAVGEVMTRMGCEMSAAALADVLQRSLQGCDDAVRERQEYMVNDTGEAGEVAESVARDAQLRAYAKTEHLQRAHEESVATLEREIEKLRGQYTKEEVELRLLGAQMAGEKAVVEFANERGVREEGVNVRRIRRRCQRRYEGVRKVEDLARQLCEGNVKLLREGRVILERVEAWGGLLGDRVKDVAEECERRLEGLEEGLRKVEEDGDEATVEDKTGVSDGGEAVGEEDCMCADTLSGLRREELEAWSDGLGRTKQALLGRTEGLCEEREIVVKRIESDLVPWVERLAARGSECRERDAVFVRDELKNLVYEPGKDAAPWLWQR